MSKAKKLIFVIDRERVTSGAVSHALINENGGYIVTGISQHDTALEMLSRSRPDLVVLRHNLPSADSLKFLFELRERRIKTPDIIVYGPEGQGDIRTAALMAGATIYVETDSGQAIASAILKRYSQ